MVRTWAAVAALGLLTVVAVVLDLRSARREADDVELRDGEGSMLVWIVRLMGGTPKWR